ncbi:hypothetical protein RYZ26_18395 [Terasakiella sp. A23]|uniref:hypothetical protein n=1 Tax=Terasakiella sp. FCG-A23 TaxID=3080561 RepID=UPI0029545483|nr:hypothetical protein [Terasakiella sp. A23]MDV7341581.1 hypothetical protein [Terasakiella sp. A23]
MDVKEWRRKQEEEKSLRQHVAETCMAIKDAYQEEKFEKRLKKREEDLQAPSLTERADRIRRNLMIVAGVTIFYKTFDLQITSANSSSAAFFGLKIEGLTPEAIDTGLMFLLAYLVVHFFVEASRTHLLFLAHTFKSSNEDTVVYWTSTLWNVRYFLLESLLPFAMGYWALGLLPIKETLLRWWWA